MQGMVIAVEWTEQRRSSLIQTDEELLEKERVKGEQTEKEQILLERERDRMHKKFSLYSICH